MKLTILDNHMNIVDHISNHIPNSLKYKDDTFHIYADIPTSTFDFTVEKFQNGKLNPRLEHLTAASYIAFVYRKRTYVYNMRKIVEDDYEIQYSCEDTNFEMLNETVREFTATVPMTMDEYISAMGLFQNTNIQLGLNEVENVKLLLEFTDTVSVTQRIMDLADKFGTELDLVTVIHQNGVFSHIVCDIYKAPTVDSEPGVGKGRDRQDVKLFFGRELRGVRMTSSRENQFTAVRVFGKDKNPFKAQKSRTIKTADGENVDIFVTRNSGTIYAPVAMQLYPSIMKRNNCDNWVVRDIYTELTTEEALWEYGSKVLKKYMYPEVTYEITLNDYRVLLDNDIAVGDTVYLKDPNFLGGLLFRARVSEMEISFTDPLQSKVTLTNAVRLKSQISDSLRARMETLVAESAPYILNVTSTGGYAFKTIDDSSIFTPSLNQNGKEVESTDKLVTYQYYLDDEYISTGFSLTFTPSMFNGKEKGVLRIDALINDEKVTFSEITLYNVEDGVSPILMRIDSSNGTAFKNGIINTVLKALLYRENTEVDPLGEEYIYKWVRVNNNGILDTNFSHIGKTVTVTEVDVLHKAVYKCSITKKEKNQNG